MNCSQCRSLLTALLSESLSESQQREVETHLETCAECARELKVLRSIQATLSELPTAAPPSFLRTNVRAALEDQPVRKWPFAIPFNWRISPSFYAGGLALATLCLIVLSRPFYNNPNLLLPTATATPDTILKRADKPATKQAPAEISKAAVKADKKPASPLVRSVQPGKTNQSVPSIQVPRPPTPQFIPPSFNPSLSVPSVQAEPKFVHPRNRPDVAPVPSRPQIVSGSIVPPPSVTPKAGAGPLVAKIAPQRSLAKSPPAPVPQDSSAQAPAARSRVMPPSVADADGLTAKDAATVQELSAPAANISLTLRPSVAASSAGNMALSAGAETRKSAGFAVQSQNRVQTPAPMMKWASPSVQAAPETTDSATTTNGAAPAMRSYSAPQAPSVVAPAPTHDYVLEVRSDRDVAAAQLKIFGPLLDKAAKESVAWRGKLAAKSPTSIPVQIAASDKKQQFQATLEQIEADGQSKVLKTEIFAVP